MGTRERRARSNESDRYLRSLYHLALEKFSMGDKGIAVAAVGGYGRGELSPGSDLDILILHTDAHNEELLGKFVNELLYPIWDKAHHSELIPTSVDHSVRTRTQTRDAAHDDLRVALGLLDIRLVAGDADLVAAVQSDAIDEWRKDSKRRLPQLRASMQERHEKAGELAYLLEPDLKEARGGLRDINALRAVALSGAVEVPIERISHAEATLNNAREALHIASGRNRDQLLFQEQDKVAEFLNYSDADALMAEIATSARTIDYVIQSMWHRIDHRGKDGLGRFLRKPRVTSVAKNLSVLHQEVILDHDIDYKSDPVLPLRAAATAAQLGLPLSLDSCIELAANFHELPNPWPREARENLVALIGAGSAMVQVWEALDQEGIITRLLPEWTPLRSLPQRNVLHRHTVDRHMVETAVHAAALTRQVHRPDLLLVAALFHDLGKGTEADHSIRGAELITPLVRRLGFPESDVKTLELLVAHHLLISATATRRDLDDPATVSSVIAVIPDVQTLELLHALSIADGEATGKTAWSSWKASLVADLVNRVRVAMSDNTIAPEPELSAEQRAFAEVGALRVDVIEHEGDYAIEIIAPDRPGLLSVVAGVLNLARLDVRSARTRSHGSAAVMRWIVSLDPFASAPTADKLRSDIDAALHGKANLENRLAERAKAYDQLPSIAVPPAIVETFPDASSAATVLEVRSHDRVGLLFRIGDAVTRSRVDIRSAIVTTLGAEAIDTLYVLEISGEQLTPERAREVAAKIEESLR